VFLGLELVMQKTDGAGKQVTLILDTFSLNMNKAEKNCHPANYTI
jgi:hypothetical protein